MVKIKSSEITPEHVYLSRRKFIAGASAAASVAALAACGPSGPIPAAAPPIAEESATQTPPIVETEAPAVPTASKRTDEFGDELTSFESVTNYNNFYEFTTSKEGVARSSQDFQTRPWTLAVGGLVNNPKTYAIEDLLSRFAQEERIYRLRCVEAWSMVIPWLGFSLAALLREVEPTSEAKYVRFETLFDLDQMPGLKSPGYTWPYVEGLRPDEAMHDLTILSTGLYGKELLPQNGAPLRLVVPWKYGFKSIKSIVKIDLVAEMPTSLWMAAASNEYGFYANVNPDVSHPRWSQASERRIGELSRRKTLPFNGYAEEVAELYAGMDLAKYY